MNIITKRTTNGNGTPQVIAKGGGKQRTVNAYPEFSREQNHGKAAGTLALALGLSDSDDITCVETDTGFKFSF